MKVGLAQIFIAYANPQINRKTIQQYIKKASEAGIDTIVFPEMWNVGYALDQLPTLADPAGQTTQHLLKQLAQSYQINIVGGSVATKEGNRFYNTTYVVNRFGQIVGQYQKVHLFGLMKENQYLSSGSHPNRFILDSIPSSSFICYDLRFPEWWRTTNQTGIQVNYLPAEWPEERIEQWEILVRARAIENQAFVIAVNAVGNNPTDHFGGHSMVVDPLGRILTRMDDQPGLKIVEFNPQKALEIRGPIPVFKDRSPDLYN